MESLDCHSTSL